MSKSILIRVTAHGDEYDDISAELMFVDYQDTPQGFDVELLTGTFWDMARNALADNDRLRIALATASEQVGTAQKLLLEYVSMGELNSDPEWIALTQEVKQ